MDKNVIFALDIGTRSVIGSVGIVKEKKFEVLEEVYKEHEERAMIDGQIHDISLVAKVVEEVKKALEEKLGFSLEEVSIAAAGRFLRTVNGVSQIKIDNAKEIDKETIRSVELSAVKVAEKEVLKGNNSKLYCVGYSVYEHYLNSYVISNLLGHKGERIGAKVIATFLPRSVIDSLYAVMDKVNLKVASLTLEPIAAIEAAVPKNLRLLNIALVDIGAGTSDIAISSRESISAYGMVPIAGDKVTEAIAHECLVDFNCAEQIKRKLSLEEEVTYSDILGFENVADKERLYDVITPSVDRIAEAIGDEILKLNGDKAPAAVFLVGGGAHTLGLIERLANKISLPVQRIAIKDRTSVIDCFCDNELGSAGVTVLGIALSHIKKIGDNFIDVYLNDKPISLFNSHKHSIMDVLLQGGTDPSRLIGRKGKSIRYTLNGKRRLSFGEGPTPPSLYLNNKKSTLESLVSPGDKIKVNFAVNGKDACPSVSEIIDTINSISFFINDELFTIEPIIMVNNKEEKPSYKVKNEDEIIISLENRVKEVRKGKKSESIELYREGKLLDPNYQIVEGDRLTTFSGVKEEMKELTVIKVNGDEIHIDKEKPVFIDIFNYIDFDISKVSGNVIFCITWVLPI